MDDYVLGLLHGAFLGSIITALLAALRNGLKPPTNHGSHDESLIGSNLRSRNAQESRSPGSTSGAYQEVSGSGKSVPSFMTSAVSSGKLKTALLKALPETSADDPEKTTYENLDMEISHAAFESDMEISNAALESNMKITLVHALVAPQNPEEQKPTENGSESPVESDMEISSMTSQRSSEKPEPTEDESESPAESSDPSMDPSYQVESITEPSDSSWHMESSVEFEVLNVTRLEELNEALNTDSNPRQSRRAKESASSKAVVRKKVPVKKKTKLLRVQSKTKKRFPCDICNKNFTTNQNLQSHLNAIHLKLKAFSCSICDRSFAFKASFYQHMNTVHFEKTPFKCEICYKNFTTKRNFQSHVNAVHLKLKPFSCNICDKLFAWKNGIRQHNKTAHKNLNPLSCDYCGRSFSTKAYLRQHMQRHLPKICTFKGCGKRFETTYRLNKHQKTHEEMGRGVLKNKTLGNEEISSPGSISGASQVVSGSDNSVPSFMTSAVSSGKPKTALSEADDPEKTTYESLDMEITLVASQRKPEKPKPTEDKSESPAEPSDSSWHVESSAESLEVLDLTTLEKLNEALNVDSDPRQSRPAKERAPSKAVARKKAVVRKKTSVKEKTKPLRGQSKNKLSC